MCMQSKPSFAVALRLFASKENYPVLVHCIHGKDRTGLIIMLLLLLCDVPPKVCSLASQPCLNLPVSATASAHWNVTVAGCSNRK